MSAVSCHRCTFAFVPSQATCWFDASPVLDRLECFRSHFLQEKWASGVVHMLLEGITPFAGGGNGCHEEAMDPLFLGGPAVRRSALLTRGFTPPSCFGFVCVEKGTSVFGC
jgi:hypothetical protein